MTNLKIIKIQFKTLSESEQEDFINWINKKKSKKTKKVKKVKKEENLKFKHFMKTPTETGWDKSPQEIQEEQENTSKQLIIEADNLIDFKVKLKKAIDNSINQEKETRIQLNRSEEIKKVYNTDELDKYEKMTKNLDNYFWGKPPTIEKENLEVGDMFYSYEITKEPICIITRMTAKTIFYTTLKYKKFTKWHNNLDWGGGKRIYKYNIANRDEGECRKLKTSIDEVIDPSKVNYWGDIYIGNRGI